jgi:hypothetical protein
VAPTPTSHAGDQYVFQDIPVLAVGYPAATTTTSAAATPDDHGGTRPSPRPAYFVVEMTRAQAEQITALLTGDFAQTSTATGSTQPSPGATPVVLKYVLRPTSEYGSFTVNDTVNPHTVTFGPQ